MTFLPHKIQVLGLLALSIAGGPLLWCEEAGPAPAAEPKAVLEQKVPAQTLFALPRKIYAHYMGCWPVASGALTYSKLNEDPKLRHDATTEVARRGGHVRNWDLVPYGMKLTPEDSADLEIRRALRIGIDGFAIDAWAGGNDAKRSLDALFKVAEAKDYPFEITLCIDPSCGGKIVDSVKYLLEKHGASPKLARRDGKPLVLGYMSVWPGVDHLARLNPDKTKDELTLLRTTPEGWESMGEAFADADKQLGQPIYWHFCLGAFFHGVDKKLIPENGLTAAAGAIARHVQAVGAFTGLGEAQPDIAKAVLTAGAEWSTPLGMFQKENIPYELYGGKGLDWMCDNWATVRKFDSRLLQIVTWNDYGENSNIAPAYNTRYTLYDLTGYFIQWWKTGREPMPDHDKVYLVSRKYPSEAKVFPFKQGPYLDGALEVVTILTRPAKVRLPGRNVEYEAPAGFHRRQFPVTPGPVAAELVRDGQIVLKLESPEPVTDRPLREDNSMVCISSEFERHWKADFGDAKPFLWSEYGDVDGDGLPNAFEMYWYGKFGDLATAGNADPQALTPSGKTVMQTYLDQTDPNTVPIPYAELPRDGLLAWYRADQGVGVNDQGEISEWQDQSGNNWDLQADTVARMPHLVAKCWNDLPALEFDGKRSSMLCKLPDTSCAAMTVFAVFSARDKEQMSHGAGNRLVSIPTTTKADYEGGISLCAGAIGYQPGDVAVMKREFAAGEQPTYLGLGFMVCSQDLNYRDWTFKGKVAEILVYGSALNDAETRKVISILKTRYRL